MPAESITVPTTLSGHRNTDLPDRIDALAASNLKIYVYVLVDPRTKKIFYVGKGQGERVLQHVREAEKGLDSDGEVQRKSKQQQIIDIKTSGHKPEWRVVRRNLKDADEAFHVEGSLIYALTQANDQPLSNRNRGMNTQHDGLTANEVMLLNAPQVDPNQAYPCVILLDIEKGLRERGNVYDATRRAWPIGPKFRDRLDVVVVGLVKGISRGAFRVKPGSWTELIPEERRWGFDRVEDGGSILSELELKNWKCILNQANYWLRGRHLVVEFDGNGSVKFLFGHRENNAWLPLRGISATNIERAMS